MSEELVLRFLLLMSVVCNLDSAGNINSICMFCFIRMSMFFAYANSPDLMRFFGQSVVCSSTFLFCFIAVNVSKLSYVQINA